MNDAMKTLIDKDTSESTKISPTSSSPTAATAALESRQNAIEISGYRKEIDSMRKEIAIVSYFNLFTQRNHPSETDFVSYTK